MSTSLFSNTPTVSVFNNRGLTVRDIAYHRQPDVPSVADVRLTCHQYHTRGFLTRSADPRLHDTRRANFTYFADLAGNVLRRQGADNGITMALSDAAGRPCIALSSISSADDGREDCSQAVTRSWQYENAALSARPLSVTELTPDGVSRITERFVYAGNADTEKALNLAGVCVSHYDTAGLIQTDSIALTGVRLSMTRRLLTAADSADVVADWQGKDEAAWNTLLTGAHEGYTTLAAADAAGTTLTTTDAQGNRQRAAYDVAGLLSGSWLTLKGGSEQVIVKSMTRSAAGQKLREEHGNGVVTTYTYEPRTQRLTGIKTERPAGHTSGAKVLQDLRFGYDPVGNVLKVSNDAEETRFWRNQKVVPENTYVYDSLYQLVSATGREMANAGQQGSHLPAITVPLPTDSSAYTNYIRTYRYDNAGNLTQISHSAPASRNSHTTNITISHRSNRGVLSTLTENPAEVDALFTAGGLQRQLQPGQHLSWTSRNELLRVSPVRREGDEDDCERYRYDAGSQRILKVSRQKAGDSIRTQRGLYLPGLELRITASASMETENLQVITVGNAGRAQVRVLHWESGKPDGIDNNQIRYSYDNLTGSSGLELDSDGNVISLEEYYPYGGTAILTARSAVEANYKTVRYSGKERDATGLYYYGYRYYQPWASRWLCADPAGTVDGLNLFRMVRNNPVRYRDDDGMVAEESFNTLLNLIEHFWEEQTPDTATIIDKYHSLSTNNETRKTMSDDEAIEQIDTLEKISGDMGNKIKIYPQARSDLTPKKLYELERIEGKKVSTSYYRMIANSANTSSPIQSRINISIKKEYNSAMIRAIANITLKNTTTISQSKVTAYDLVGEVAESAVIYLSTQSPATAGQIKNNLLKSLHNEINNDPFDIREALIEHPAVSMMELEKGIHYKEFSGRFHNASQGSIALGAVGIVNDVIRYRKNKPSVTAKSALEHVLKDWGYNRKDAALIKRPAEHSKIRKFFNF